MLLRILAGTLGVGLVVSAVVMLIDPVVWYNAVPGVSASGPLNSHFARDLGCANLVAGVVLLVRAVARRTPVSGVLAVAGFISLHAGVHLWELTSAGDQAVQRVVRDLSTVYLPTVLMAWLALDALKARSQRDA